MTSQSRVVVTAPHPVLRFPTLVHHTSNEISFASIAKPRGTGDAVQPNPCAAVSSTRCLPTVAVCRCLRPARSGSDMAHGLVTTS